MDERENNLWRKIPEEAGGTENISFAEEKRHST